MKKKLLVTLIFLIGILSFSAAKKNLYHVNENGKVEKLGVINTEKSDLRSSDGYYNHREYFKNGEKYYKDGKEIGYQEYYEEVISKVMKSTAYIDKSTYITEDEKYYYPYNTEKIEKKDGVKVFGGLEEVVPDVYLNYLLLKDNKIIDGNDFNVKSNNVDLGTLEQFGGNHRYFSDKNGVYYLENQDAEKNSYSYTFIKMNNIDKDSFKVLGEFYAKDKNSVYYENKKLKQADAETFEILKLNYSMEPYAFLVGYDKNGIYYGGKKISNIKMTGKVEKMDVTEFKDSKNVYLFIPDFNTENQKSVIKKLDIPVTAKNIGKFLQEDEKYVYFQDGKIEKAADFKWLTINNDVYQNDKKIYFISPWFWGITDLSSDTDNFKMIYDTIGIKAAKDKDSYYEYKNEMTEWKFTKKTESNFSLLENSTNIGEDFFYDAGRHKYYYVADAYSGKIFELENIKKIDKTFENGYFFGE